MITIKKIPAYIKEINKGSNFSQNPEKGINNAKGNIHTIKKGDTPSKTLSDNTMWGRVRLE